jgi:5-methyltetrahydropteroyltriglutamate--homocysteine methyltransferase
MVTYPRYSTTVIGAYSVPDWYEALDRLVAVGQLSMGSMADAQYRAGEAAIHDQDLAGIDVVTGGGMHRRTHNRHSPPDAMLNVFWQKKRLADEFAMVSALTRHPVKITMTARTCWPRWHTTSIIMTCQE